VLTGNRPASPSRVGIVPPALSLSPQRPWPTSVAGNALSPFLIPSPLHLDLCPRLTNVQTRQSRANNTKGDRMNTT